MAQTPQTPASPSSPVCYASEADDAYMGFATRDELVAALNELLEAERAGAYVARASLNDAPPEMADLLKSIAADEARWCAMLTAQLERLSASPSAKRGAFAEKAMAIADPHARLLFLNRGQNWVVRKLAELMPKVRDDALHAALREMSESHVHNIDAAARALESD
ncbi:MAG TPA: DUF6306 domain-containing protein [Pedomonas sp.]|uniref:DUF6306 domain-containing protein n=1 Tax=Pedomonas sp. TaxID=2976421 RepID=UPI002F407290